MPVDATHLHQLSGLRDALAQGKPDALEAWRDALPAELPAARALADHVLQGWHAAASPGREDDVRWHLALHAWTPAADDLERAIADLGLRAAADRIDARDPDLAAALLRLTHRPTRRDESEAMTLLVMTSTTPLRADLALVEQVLSLLDARADDLRDPGLASTWRAHWAARADEVRLAPRLRVPPTVSAAPTSATRQMSPTQRVLIFVLLAFAMISMMAVQSFR
jgi:hypothetical protein